MPRLKIVLAGFLAAGVAGLAAYFLPIFVAAANSNISTGSLPLNPISSPGTGPTQPFTVLLLGSDDDSKFPPDRINTQSMILVRVDPTTKQATMLSIPRDLWVDVPNMGMTKIDTAYSHGGAQSAVAAVEANFKVHVDYYVWIGLNGLVKLIDQFGGVDVMVTNPVMDDFYPSDLSQSAYPYDYYRVAVLPGAVHMDGVHALQYVRSRHGDLRGDFARSERQQQVLLALKQETSHVSVADLPALANALNGEVKTNMNLDQVRQLMAVANDFQGPNIHHIVLLPPRYTWEGYADGQDVVFPVWNQILPLVQQSFA